MLTSSICDVELVSTHGAGVCIFGTLLYSYCIVYVRVMCPYLYKNVYMAKTSPEVIDLMQISSCAPSWMRLMINPSARHFHLSCLLQSVSLQSSRYSIENFRIHHRHLRSRSTVEKPVVSPLTEFGRTIEDDYAIIRSKYG